MNEREITLREASAIHKWWEEKVLPERKPSDRIARFLEECQELQELVDEDFDEKCKDSVFAKKVGYEAIDCVIVALGIIDSLGYNASQLFWEKLAINHQKYNIVENRRLREEGLTPEEALRIQKENWSKRR